MMISSNKLFYAGILLISVTISSAAPGQSQPPGVGPETQVCRDNEQYSSCGSSCIETCQTWSPNGAAIRPCTAECVAGCFCIENYVRDTILDRCVPPQDCVKLPRDQDKASQQQQQQDQQKQQDGQFRQQKNDRSSAFSSALSLTLSTFIVVLSILYLHD